MNLLTIYILYTQLLSAALIGRCFKPDKLPCNKIIVQHLYVHFNNRWGRNRTIYNIAAALGGNIMIRLAGSSEFQWKTTEQVWPHEKGVNGETLYAKRVNTGPKQANVQLSVPHGITNLKLDKIYKCTAIGSWGNSSSTLLPYVDSAPNMLGVYLDANYLNIFGANSITGDSYFLLVYAKD